MDNMTTNRKKTTPRTLETGSLLIECMLQCLYRGSTQDPTTAPPTPPVSQLSERLNKCFSEAKAWGKKPRVRTVLHLGQRTNWSRQKVASV